MKTLLCLPMAALLITAAMAGPASADQGVPFKGNVAGTENFTPKDGGIIVDGSGGGHATHLGKFTATWGADITFTNPDNLHPMVRVFVAANGDELHAEGLGSGTNPADHPNQNQTVVENLVITGGTGRFLGAGGSITVIRVVYAVRPPFANLETAGSMNGTITLAH